MKDEPLTATELVDLVEETFESLLQLIESLSNSDLEEPSVSGSWSLKDILAHITWYEEQMVDAMEARALIGSELWNVSPQERNAAIYEEFKSAPLQDVLDDAIATHQQLVHWVGTLTDEELNEPGHFEAMPDEWTFGEILAQNTYEHYGDHAASIAKWLSNSENRN